MAIHVTPIPSTIDLAAPSFTLGTANAAGAATTAVSSNSTLLTFDTSNPAAVSASAAVGSATVASRRDHGHVGVAAITSTDNAIARFDSTAGALQNYTSNALLASDDGVITLASGQITWPGTMAASADVHTLDQYEEGTFTVTLLDHSLNPGEGQGYTSQVGLYTRVGDVCFIQFKLGTSSIGTLTGSNGIRIGGLPFTSADTTNGDGSLCVGYGEQFALGTAGFSPAVYIPKNVAYAEPNLWRSVTGTPNFTVDMWSPDGFMFCSGSYKV